MQVTTLMLLVQISSTNIKAILRRTLVSKELLENLKKVLEDPLLRDYFHEYTRRAKGPEHEYNYVDYKSNKNVRNNTIKLGTIRGSEQILDCLIATLLSKGEGHVFLIEEPEVHMHPHISRVLPTYLKKWLKRRIFR